MPGADVRLLHMLRATTNRAGSCTLSHPCTNGDGSFKEWAQAAGLIIDGKAKTTPWGSEKMTAQIKSWAGIKHHHFKFACTYTSSLNMARRTMFVLASGMRLNVDPGHSAVCDPRASEV